MTTWYLDSAAGDDTTGDGTSGLPYQTVAKAKTVVGTDDILVLVASDTVYPISSDWSSLPVGLTVRCDTIPDLVNNISAKIDAGGVAVRWEPLGDFTMENVVVQNWVAAEESFLYVGGPTVGSTPTWTMTRCVWRDMSCSGTTGSRSGLIGSGNVVNAGVYTSLAVAFNYCALINLKRTGDATNRSGFLRTNVESTNLTFTNCSFYWDSTGGMFNHMVGSGNSDQNIGSVTYRNCAFDSDHAETLDLGNANTEAFLNTVYFGNLTLPGGVVTSLNSDPLFADVANDDLRLTPASPAIDYGVVI